MFRGNDPPAEDGEDAVPVPAGSPAARRITELDAVRGLAAVTVVVGHSLTLMPQFDDVTRGQQGLALVNVLKYSPLAIVQSGDAAVILFFILSGFVLALPFLGSRAPTYRAFLAKRVCRIYLPYLAAVAVAVACAMLLGNEALPNLSRWANAPWHGGVGAGALADHATMLGSFDNATYDPVLWSLVHEMRISLVFPLLVLAVLALGARRSAVAACAALAAGLLLNMVGVRLHHPSDYFQTLYYVPCFVAGILLARHRHEVLVWFERLDPYARWGLLVAGVLLFTYPSWMDPAWLPQAHRHHADDILAVTLGGSALMVWALGSGPVARVLRGRLPQFLGRISYSLYLLHAVVLLAFAHLLSGEVPIGVVIGLMWLVVIPLAALTQRWVEAPAIGLGRHLAARWDSRTRVLEVQPAHRVHLDGTDRQLPAVGVRGALQDACVDAAEPIVQPASENQLL